MPVEKVSCSHANWFLQQEKKNKQLLITDSSLLPRIDENCTVLNYIFDDCSELHISMPITG